jgi:hypothetical protein
MKEIVVALGMGVDELGDGWTEEVENGGDLRARDATMKTSFV